MCSSQVLGEAAAIAMSDAQTLPRQRSSRAQRKASTTSARGSAHMSPMTDRSAISTPLVIVPGNQPRSSSPTASQDSSIRDPSEISSGRHTGSTSTMRSSLMLANRFDTTAMRSTAASRTSCGSIAPGGNMDRTRRWISARSASLREFPASCSRSRSAVQALSNVCITARTMPGRCRTSSSSWKPPSSSAAAIALDSKLRSARCANPPASREAISGSVSTSRPISPTRAASSRRMRNAKGPSTRIARHFMQFVAPKLDRGA